MNKSSFTAASTFPVKILGNKNIMFTTKEKHIVPWHVQLCPTNKCPLNCTFCSCANRDKGAEISANQLEILFNTLYRVGTRAMTITGGGEPLAYKHLDYLFSLAKETNIQTGLVTNAILLDEKKHTCLKDCTWVRISISENMKVLNKVKSFIKNGDYDNVDWAFSFVLTKNSKYEDLKRTIEVANELNFSHVRVVDDILDDDTDSNMDRYKLRLLEDNVDVSLVIFQGRKTYDKGTKNCLISLLKPTIDAKGDIYPCCIEENESVALDKDGDLVMTPIKDVKIGDYAWGNGKVLNTFTSVKDKALKITLTNGQQVTVSHDHTMLKLGEHKFLYKRDKLLTNAVIDEIEAGKLQVGDILPLRSMWGGVNNYTFNDDECFILGTYLAEGWCSTRDKSFSLMLGLHETDKKDKIVKILPKTKVYERRTGWQIVCTDKDWYNKVIKFGGRSNKKQIPDWFFNTTPNNKEKLIRAYFDGDGHLYTPSKNRNGYLISLRTVSKKLASDLLILLKTMGIYGTVSEEVRDKMVIEGRTVSCRNIFTVKIGGWYNFSKLLLFPEIIKIGTKHPKRAIGYGYYEEATKLYTFSKIKKIEEVDGGNFVDLQIEGTNKFITSFGIEVHNCGIQYAMDPPALDFDERMRMGNIFNHKDVKHIFGNNTHFDGSNCVKCYYKSYNDLLSSIQASKDVEHQDFV